MTALSDDFIHRLDAYPEAITACCTAFAAWAQRLALPEKTIFQIDLILDELLTNIAMHGSKVSIPSIMVHITKNDDGRTLLMVIRDTAPPFNPFDPFDHFSSPPVDNTTSLAQRPIGGLGLAFVRQLTQSRHYRRDDNHNELTLVKSIAPNV